MKELLIGFLNLINKDAVVISIAVLPFFELKAAIPAGISMAWAFILFMHIYWL